MVQVNKRVPKTPKQAVNLIDNFLNAELFKALGDRTRLLLLSCVAKCGRACSVSEAAECCSVDFSVVSRHLGILTRAGVLESSKIGRTMAYRVLYKELSTALRDLGDVIKKCDCSNTKDVCGKAC